MLQAALTASSQRTYGELKPLLLRLGESVAAELHLSQKDMTFAQFWVKIESPDVGNLEKLGWSCSDVAWQTRSYRGHRWLWHTRHPPGNPSDTSPGDTRVRGDSFASWRASGSTRALGVTLWPIWHQTVVTQTRISNIFDTFFAPFVCKSAKATPSKDTELFQTGLKAAGDLLKSGLSWAIVSPSFVGFNGDSNYFFCIL